MIKTLVLIISVLILVIGATWVIMTLSEPEVITKTVYRTQTVPQIVTVEDNSQIKKLQNELNEVRRQLENQIRINTYNTRDVVYYSDRYYDRYDRRSRDEHDLIVKVRDEDRDPIEDARVKVQNGDTEVEYTDDDGEAEFNNLEENCYDIRVSADGFDSEEDDICLEDDERITIELQT